MVVEELPNPFLYDDWQRTALLVAQEEQQEELEKLEKEQERDILYPLIVV